jgi:hypothetical protein
VKLDGFLWSSCGFLMVSCGDFCGVFVVVILCHSLEIFLWIFWG